MKVTPVLLRSEMKYYVDDPEQTEEVQRKLDAIKYRNVNPEEIRDRALLRFWPYPRLRIRPSLQNV